MLVAGLCLLHNVFEVFVVCCFAFSCGMILCCAGRLVDLLCLWLFDLVFV